MKHIEDRLIRLEDKIDKVIDKTASIDVTLAAQHVSLKEHIRRTEILEEEIKPIKRHVAMLQGCLKFFGLVAMSAGIVEGFVVLLDYMRVK
jgi:hypothetical protein